MTKQAARLYQLLFEELDPEKFQRRFLDAVLHYQKVKRGSLWVKKNDRYLCVEAAGDESATVKGVSIGADRQSVVGWVIENGKMTVAEVGKDTRHFKELEERFADKSSVILCFPLILKSGQVYGAVEIIETAAKGARLNLDANYLELLENLVAIGSIALSTALDFTGQVQENQRLKRELKAIRDRAPIVGQSESFLKIMETVQTYARTDFPVCITGESGTGKEVIAKEIHRLSSRRDKPFLVQNCSAIPDTLLESELFGYKKGAFTGANQDKDGLFVAADGGGLFLDEIGDMPLGLQAKILRVIQSGEVKALGGTSTRIVDVRLISATNRDLTRAIAAQTFREDLYYRLNVLPLHLPPLRERKEDIPLLLQYFFKSEAQRLGAPVKSLSPEARKRLLRHPWRGNIRELENFVKYILTIADNAVIEEHDLPATFFQAEQPDSPRRAEQGAAPLGASPGEFPFADYSWEDFEKTYLLALLQKTKWNVTRAADLAKVNRSTFDSRLKKLGITKA